MSDWFEEFTDRNNGFDGFERKKESPLEVVNHISGAVDRLHSVLAGNLSSKWSGESYALHCEREMDLYEDALEALEVLRRLCPENK